jgi:hypothetical protein
MPPRALFVRPPVLSDLDARGATLPASQGPGRRWPCAPDRIKLLTGRTYEPADDVQAPPGSHGPAADIGLTNRRGVGVPGYARADLAPYSELADLIPDDRALGAYCRTSQRFGAVRACMSKSAVRSFLSARAGRQPGCCILAVTCVWSAVLTVLAPVPDIGATQRLARRRLTPYGLPEVAVSLWAQGWTAMVRFWQRRIDSGPARPRRLPGCAALRPARVNGRLMTVG